MDIAGNQAWCQTDYITIYLVIYKFALLGVLIYRIAALI